MRTAILLSGIIIADSLGNKATDRDGRVTTFLAITLICCILMDAVDFIKQF